MSIEKAIKSKLSKGGVSENWMNEHLIIDTSLCVKPKEEIIDKPIDESELVAVRMKIKKHSQSITNINKKITKIVSVLNKDENLTLTESSLKLHEDTLRILKGFNELIRKFNFQ